MKQLQDALTESLSSVLPIAAIVLLLSITLIPLLPGVMVLFLFGTFLLIFGIGLFSIGSEMSMKPLGEGIGAQMGKAKHAILPILICFFLGAIITIAEPDLQVLAEQVPNIPNIVLILCVACGVGVFLSIAIIRMKTGIPLSRLLIIFYILVFVLACFAPNLFVPTAFDSGGVTTGPVTVPFIMAIGAGMAALATNKNARENSFGLVALCSIGPILSVIILSICFKPEATQEAVTELPSIATTQEAFLAFLKAIPHYAKEMLMAFLPIVGIFLIFQLISRRFHLHQILKITIGFVYTYVGLVLFLTGANVGFMPAGQLIGQEIAQSGKYWLIPIGMIMGYFIVTAEPAVHSLKKQVEEVTNGAIAQKSIGYALSIGVAVSIGISMLRILFSVPLFPILVVGYALSLGISFLVPPIYTGIAFDSGGVASGALATTFLLPFARGACEKLGGNIMEDAFGIVALIAMTPLITIQVLGLIGQMRQRNQRKKVHSEMIQIKDDIVYYDGEEA